MDRDNINYNQIYHCVKGTVKTGDSGKLKALDILSRALKCVVYAVINVSLMLLPSTDHGDCSIHTLPLLCHPQSEQR